MGKIYRASYARILTGIAITVILCAVLLSSHIPFVLYSFTALLSIAGVWELHHTVRRDCKDWLTYFCMLLAIAVVCSPMEIYSVIIAFLFPLSILLFGFLMCRIEKTEHIHTEILLFISATIILFYRAIPELREKTSGFYLLIAAVLTGSITDIGAYAIGSKVGKRKLAPKISPNKTWEGAIGGILTAFVVMMSISNICERFGLLSVDEPLLASYILWASIVGQFGDLAMSSIKRISGVKDYADYLPGHGGLLDRFDSLMFIAPFTYLFCQYCGSFYS